MITNHDQKPASERGQVGSRIPYNEMEGPSPFGAACFRPEAHYHILCEASCSAIASSPWFWDETVAQRGNAAPDDGSCRKPSTFCSTSWTHTHCILYRNLAVLDHAPLVVARSTQGSHRTNCTTTRGNRARNPEANRALSCHSSFNLNPAYILHLWRLIMASQTPAGRQATASTEQKRKPVNHAPAHAWPPKFATPRLEHRAQLRASCNGDYRPELRATAVERSTRCFGTCRELSPRQRLRLQHANWPVCGSIRSFAGGPRPIAECATVPRWCGGFRLPNTRNQ